MLDALENAPVRSAFCNDEDFQELIEMFIDGIAEKQQVLNQASITDQREEIQVLAHQLKGSGAGYGFDELSRLAAELEQACKTGDPVMIVQHKELLSHYLGRIVL